MTTQFYHSQIDHGVSEKRQGLGLWYGGSMVGAQRVLTEF